jgi:hypothetical protein
MNGYLVTWQIDMDADTPEEAAIKALHIMRDEESSAKYFLVGDEDGEIHEVDLCEVEV